MRSLLTSIYVIAIVAILATGCDKANSGDPKVVLTEFFQRMSKKDFDGAAKLATKESQSMFSMMKMGMDMAEKYKGTVPESKEDEMAEQFKQIEIGNARVEGEIAYVPVKNKNKEFDLEFPLRKEDGGWKVDFTMQTMMKMAKDAGNAEGLDTLRQNISTEEMEKGMKMADSIMKNMDPEKMKEMMKQFEKMKDQQ